MSARRAGVRVAAFLGVWLVGAPLVGAASGQESSFLRGLGKVIGGILLELPKTTPKAVTGAMPYID